MTNRSRVYFNLKRKLKCAITRLKPTGKYIDLRMLRLISDDPKSQYTINDLVRLAMNQNGDK